MSLISDELGQASTKKKEFLGIMEKLIPWSEWVGIVQPHYYKGERGNKPYDLELMLRIYVLQHLYNLADDAARNEIIDSRAFSQFCGCGLQQSGAGWRYHRAFSASPRTEPARRGVFHECGRKFAEVQSDAEKGNDCGFDADSRAFIDEKQGKAA